MRWSAGVSALLALLLPALVWAQTPAGDAPAQGAPKAEDGDKAPAPAEDAAPAAAPAVSAEPPSPASAGGVAGKESACDDGVDNDRDGMTDCADSDCTAEARCQPGGGSENTNARCSDWVDNDGDGAVDCDDRDCEGPGVTVCKGSWKGPLDTGGGAQAEAPVDDIPQLGEGMSVEDLIGTGDDKDGERNNMLCSDGLDNDGDGKIDCADFGCRFDSSVTVCRGNPGMRFSIVAMVGQSYTFKSPKVEDEGTWDTRFTGLQLRSFGPIPLIQDSFYLLSMRTEKTPRMTFAMFQIPLGSHGHMLNINSGGGGLSLGAVLSSGKHLLTEPAYYMTSAFQGGNGAAVEVLGPIGDGSTLRYRTYVAGGAGRFTGNIGGRYFTYGKTNYTYSIGGEVAFNVVGSYSPWDSAMLYTTVPTTFSAVFGAKFDQRATEQFPAAHAQLLFRGGRATLRSEAYYKLSTYTDGGKDHDFSALAYQVEAGFLVWPKYLLIAADYGAFVPSAKLEDVRDTDLKRQLDEMQWRVALHYYFLRNIGVLSAVYQDRSVRNANGGPADHTQEFNLIAQYRF